MRSTVYHVDHQVHNGDARGGRLVREKSVPVYHGVVMRAISCAREVGQREISERLSEPVIDPVTFERLA